MHVPLTSRKYDLHAENIQQRAGLGTLGAEYNAQCRVLDRHPYLATQHEAGKQDTGAGRVAKMRDGFEKADGDKTTLTNRDFPAIVSACVHPACAGLRLAHDHG
jgi:hypothetical protein